MTLTRFLGLYSVATTLGLAALLFARDSVIGEKPQVVRSSAADPASRWANSSDAIRYRFTEDQSRPIPETSSKPFTAEPPRAFGEQPAKIDVEQLQRQAATDLQTNVLRYISLTDDEKARMQAAYQKTVEIDSADLAPEEKERLFAEIPTDETILGPDRYAKLAEAREQEEIRWREEGAERTVAYLEQAMGFDLSPEQENRARVALRAFDESDPNARTDADVAFLQRRLGLTGEQLQQVRKGISAFYLEPEGPDSTEMLVNGAMVNGEGDAENPELQSDQAQTMAFVERIAPHLSPQQQQRLAQMVEQGTSFRRE